MPIPSCGLREWLTRGEHGGSSLVMAKHLAPLAEMKDYVPLQTFQDPKQHPLDPDDFRRCLLLLTAVPGLRKHLPRMAEVSPEWAALVGVWGELEALFREELPSGRAPKLYDRMQSLTRPGDRPMPEPGVPLTSEHRPAPDPKPVRGIDFAAEDAKRRYAKRRRKIATAALTGLLATDTHNATPNGARAAAADAVRFADALLYALGE